MYNLIVTKSRDVGGVGMKKLLLVFAFLLMLISSRSSYAAMDEFLGVPFDASYDQVQGLVKHLILDGNFSDKDVAEAAKLPTFHRGAEKVAGFLFNNPNMPEDLVPYWDFDCPDIPDTYRDVSSAAIIASALYELYGMTENSLYKEKADKIIESLSSPAYRAEPGTNGGFILMHSVGSIPHGSSIDVPLNYADYYFLEALIRKGNIEKGLAPVK